MLLILYFLSNRPVFLLFTPSPSRKTGKRLYPSFNINYRSTRKSITLKNQEPSLSICVVQAVRFELTSNGFGIRRFNIKLDLYLPSFRLSSSCYFISEMDAPARVSTHGMVAFLLFRVLRGSWLLRGSLSCQSTA